MLNEVKRIKKIGIGMVIMLMVMSVLVPVSATELPDTITPSTNGTIHNLFVDNSENVLTGLSITKMAAIEDVGESLVYCLDKSAIALGSQHAVVDVENLHISYDKVILDTILRYPIVGNVKDFPTLNSSEYANVNDGDKEQGVRQMAIWYYQSTITNNVALDFSNYESQINTYGDDKTKALYAEISAFVAKAVSGDIVIEDINDIEVSINSDRFELNESTGYYETGIYDINIIGNLITSVSVKELNISEDIELIDEKNNVISVNDKVESFKFRVLENNYNNLDNGKINIKLSSTVNGSEYKVYKSTESSVNTRQDLGIIVPIKTSIEKDVSAKKIEISSQEEKPTKLQKVVDDDRNNALSIEKEDSVTAQTTKTGDNSGLPLWIGVSVASLGVVFKLIRKLIKKC